jgi:hypothetical protein
MSGFPMNNISIRRVSPARRIVMGQCRSAAHQVLDSTDSLVQKALSGDWLLVLDISERRRRMLDDMEDAFMAEHDCASVLSALNAAVYESERVVTQVIARAVIDMQFKGERAAG